MPVRSLAPSLSRSLPSHYKWLVVAMLWWISFFNYADRQAIFSVFPLLKTEMGLDTVQLGLLGSSFAWVYGLCAPIAGSIVDRVRRKSAILGGLHAWSIICMATALSRNFRHLLFFRAAEGLGETFYYPASMSMVSDYHGRETRSRAMGLHQTSVYIGTIAGGFFAGLIGQRYGWRWSFIIFGGLGVVLGAILNRFLIEPKRGATDAAAVEELPVATALGIIWSTPTVLTLMAGFMCANFVHGVLLAWLPTYLYDKFHFNLAMSGFMATIFLQLASMVGSPLGGWIADRLRARYAGGRIMVQACAVLLGAPFIVLCGVTTSVSWLIAGLIGWGLCKGLYDANIFASAFDVVRPEARGATAGFMNALGWLGGGGTAPLVIGYIAKRTTLGQGIAMSSSVYVLAGVVLTCGILFFVRKDVARMQASVGASRV